MIDFLTAPFPYHGGKRHLADEVWMAFGRLDCYVEPFCGSLSVLLKCPNPAKLEIGCDMSPLVANFWRAVKHAPEEVAFHADYPTIHHDYHARSKWVWEWGREHSDEAFDDPMFFDSRAAGWWAWGKSIAIGSDFPTKGNDARIPSVSGIGGCGVAMQRRELKDIRPAESEPLDGSRIRAWIDALARRLENVAILRKPWTSAITPAVLHLGGKGKSRNAVKTTGVFLDPPYLTRGRRAGIYESDDEKTSDDAARDSYAWAVEAAEKWPALKIAYCCRDGDFPVPEGWRVKVGKLSAHRSAARNQEYVDCMMLSPSCLGQEKMF